MNSAIYAGHVRHERKVPKHRKFKYGLYYVYLDLAELDDLNRSLKHFGHDGPGLMKLRDRDHGPRDGSPLRPWIDDLLARADIVLGDGGRVCLLTFPRVLGFGFYPVSFWYCFGGDGEPRAILAEVHNTFGEHHNYLLHAHGAPMDWKQRPEATKVFHVSPFIEMDGRYEFHFTPPGDKLAISLYDYIKGDLLLIAGVSVARRDLTDAEIMRTFWRYGPMSLRAWLLIHWQALHIVAKRISYVPKPPPPSEETSI